MKRIGLTLACLALAGCQTLPKPHGLNEQQITLLKQEGFTPKGDDWMLGLADRTLFAVDESRLLDAQNEHLGQMAQRIVGVGIVGAKVEGNTDSTGSARHNLELSRQRAASVVAALKAGGMNPARLRAEGLGASNPVESNATPEGRAQNRRVVIIIGPQDTAQP